MPKSSHSITDKFSTRLKKAFVTAAKMAESENMTALRTDHLVQALYFQEGSIAAEVLRKSNIKPTVFRKNMPAIGDSALPTIMPGKDALNPKTKDISNLGKLFNLVQKNDIKKTQDLHLSQGLEKALMKAALLAKKFNHSFIGTEHMLLAILENPKNKICQLLAQNKVNVKDIKEQVKNILASTAKFTDMTIMFSPEHKKGAKRTETIKTYCEDLTTKKKSKTIDPLIGRDKEIERMINVLGRRNKNNVLLIGEPGVGKTAIVEGLAKRMSAGDIPPLLREKKILQLDLAKMIAGTMFRGEFEGRLKSLIEEAEKDPNAIIFVDELHSIIGLGNAQGSMDATNIIKPALTSGNFQCIGITTFDEYRKHIENDPAFERRFQKIKIEEPEVEEAIKIISGVKEFYENYHGVKIEPDAIKETVKLSHRYLPEKCLPDKALDLLDEASSKVNIKLSDSKLFDKIETKRKELIKTSKQKSKAVVKEKFEEALSLQAREQTLKKEIATLKSKEKRDRKEWPTITSEDIAQVISEATNIPVKRLIKEEKDKLLNLEETLRNNIIGQDEAIENIAKFTRRARSGLAHPERPVGSFMFLGPTGTGKTELAKVIAKEIYEDEDALIRIDMSEFSEKFNASKLIGAPAGYVGYEEGGKLTEAVKKRPYSVVLFDEIEKAHPDIFNLLLQILDEGFITDASGRKINFRNTIIIMTSNTGTKSILEEEMGFKDPDKTVEEDYKIYSEKIEKDLKETFRPEFLNRIDRILIFKPLSQESIDQIVKLQLKDLQDRLMKEKEIELLVGKDVRKEIARKGFDPERGARPLRKAIQEIIEDDLAEKIIKETIIEGDRIKISKGKNGLIVEKI